MSGARPRRTRLWRILRGVVLVIAGLYLLAVGVVFTFQRSFLYFPDPALVAPDPGGPPMQVVRLTAKDGEHLVAWYLPPAAGKPILLYFGGNGDSLIGGSERWRLIAKAGAGVFALGYRGYSGSSGHPTEAGLRQDAEAAYAWVAAHYPASQIVIHGHSLGAGVAVRLAAAHPAKALILESPFTSAAEVGALKLPWAPVSLLMWDRYASRDWIGKVHMPVLIVHGDQDEVIPFQMGQALFALANPPKAFIRIPGGGHNNLPDLGLYDRMWTYLAALPPPTGSEPPPKAD